MNSDLSLDAERVWHATLPFLRRRRRNRRALKGGATASLLAALILAWALQADLPGPPRTGGPVATSPPPRESTSLAVLVVDGLGARFEQLSPDQAAGEGLQFELTLEPVFTSPRTY